jgi:hypothetical protein
MMARGAVWAERAAPRLAAGLAIAVVVLATAACGAGPGAGGDETTTSAPRAEVFFPQQRPGGESMMAETSGELILDDEGCLRVKANPKDPGTTPVWPADYELDAGGGDVRVLDEEGRVAASVGQEVFMGGGEVGSIEGISAVDERTARELRERCPGEYWLVGTVVRIPRRG